MRILLVCPVPLGSTSGNAVSVARLAAGLRARGHEVHTLAAGGEGAARDLDRLLRRARPDVVHLYHAWRTGRFARAVPAEVPLVLGIGGTDVNRDLDDPEHARAVEEALRRAEAVLAPTEDARARILRHVPEARVRVVPKGVVLPDLPFPIRASLGIPDGDALLFLPAAIRGVKGPLAAARAVARLRALVPAVRALYAGPALEEAYAAEFRGALGERDVWTPTIPRERMAAAYRAADVVLNASTQEGLSNALLEAMALGRAALVSDIPANRALVAHGETGLLFADEAGFVGGARALLGDPSLRERLGAEAASFVRTRHDPALEIDRTLEGYREALSPRRRAAGA